MSTSLNGWAGIFKINGQGNRTSDYASPLLRTIKIAGTNKQVTLQKDFAPLGAALLFDLNYRVAPLDAKGALGPDGYEYRDARTGDGLSNHASGSAFDYRYDWLRADHARHMTQAQTDEVNRILNAYTTSDGRRIFGWGGDWKEGKSLDEMHFEVIQSWSPGSGGRNGSVADVKDVIKRLGISSDGTRAIPVQVTGGGPVTAVWMAKQLGTQVARLIRFNPWLLARRARPGEWVRVPPGIVPKPLHRGP